ncbi:hypothetical protein GIY30_12060 [Gordonia sp. HNM0687]|uniref:MaoC-like domain-containing protein n=1 Tax=Gordonia mangrovi TaxID=2665643 RepID=A0A6L7GQ62_9ACTN|nr:MaoC family dehydratase [Gordonia mangrovi]MDY6807708.1 MaoC family dehydratase [Actinomycetota bacterium]MXP22079.1 hypothetical protein [Gordonia mangrovi]UVF77998.1 MaoC family dehydratase [Gordonia mangrovi]
MSDVLGRPGLHGPEWHGPERHGPERHGPESHGTELLGHLWDAEEYLTLDRVRRYAEASGDSNAIHIDPAAARAVGLAAPVAHGLLLVAIILAYAQRWAGSSGAVITGCDTRFVRPVLVGEEPTVLHLTGTLASEGHITATVWVLDADGVTHRPVIRPIRLSYAPAPG